MGCIWFTDYSLFIFYLNVFFCIGDMNDLGYFENLFIILGERI